MITKEQYIKMMTNMSVETCGLGHRTIKECNPPSIDNQKCSMCNKPLWKE